MYRFDGPLSKIGISPELSNHFMNGYIKLKKMIHSITLKKNCCIQIRIFENIMFLNIFSQFFNLNISIVPVCISMKFVPVVDNIQMEGTVSQIFDIGPRFYFMIRETFCNCFFYIYSLFHKMKINTSI